MSKSSFDYKTKLNQSRKRLVKRVATLTVASTLAFTVSPTLFNSLNDSVLGPAVAYAQSGNLMDSNEITSKFYVSPDFGEGISRHTLIHDGFTEGLPEGNLVYTLQFPDELAYLLDDEMTVQYLKEEFVAIGFVLDQNNERTTISSYDHPADSFVSINKETNSVVFNFSEYLQAYNLKTVERTSYGFNNGIYTGYKGIDNGDYIFHAALTEGPANIGSLPDAYSITMSITYNDEEPEVDPEPEVDQNPIPNPDPAADSGTDSDSEDGSKGTEDDKDSQNPKLVVKPVNTEGSNNTSNQIKVSTTEEGGKLPKTATNTLANSLAGATAALLGLGIFVIRRFKRTI